MTDESRLSETTRRRVVRSVGASLGVAASVGMAAHQRDRIAERLRGLLDRDA